MAQQHLARIPLETSPHHRRRIAAYVGRDAGGQFFPTDEWEEAHAFSSKKAADKAAAAVACQIRSAAALCAH